MGSTNKKCICPLCGREANIMADKCEKCHSSLFLNSVYRLIKILGHNTGVTYQAYNESSHETVVIKELSINKLDSWKEQELFEREMNVLKQLDHPGIPKFKDSFFINAPGRQVFYFVQEYLQGKNIKTEMETHRYTEKEVLEFIKKVLDILVYLQNLRPPVIHRDIKPSNIISKTDGVVSLIDFGAVIDISRPAHQGSTVAGTFGYMPPEQMYGRAVPNSDVYGLGMTAIVMLSRKNPEDMLDDDFQLDWDAHVTVSPPVKILLQQMIDHSPLSRPNPTEALELVAATIEELEHPTINEPVTIPKINQLGILPARKQNTDKDRAIESWKKRTNYNYSDDEVIEYSPKKSGTAVGIFVVFILIFIVIANLIITGSHKSIDNSHSSQYSTESEIYSNIPVSEEASPVPWGIKGVTFGMSHAEVIQAFPEAKQAKKSQLAPITESSRELGYKSFSITPKGFLIEVETTIGEFPANCVLYFAVDNTLSKIECTLEPVTPESAHKQAEEAIITQFYGKYGKADSFSNYKPSFEFDFDKIRRTWEWKDDNVSLVFVSHYFWGELNLSNNNVTLFPDSSTLTITNTWKKHEDVLLEYKSQLKNLISEEEKKAEKERWKKEQEKLKRVQEMKSNIDDDL